MADLLQPRKIGPLGVIGDPPPVQNIAGMGGLTPIVPLPTPPMVTDNPRMSAISSDPLITRRSQLESDLYNRTNPIAPTTTLGKIGHVAANVGNVLGDIFAPDAMANIPGTQLYNERIQQRDKADLEGVSKLQTEEAGRKQQAALTAYTEQRPEIEQGKIQQKLLSSLGKSGLMAEKDDAGNLTGNVVVDPNNPAAQSRQIHDNVQRSKDELEQAQTAWTQAKSDPNSPLFQQVSRRLAIAQQNASAAVTRAQAYYGNYLEHAFNKDLQGNVLPGAPQIADAEGNTTTVGSTNAGQAVKAQANVAQFGDVGGALDNLEAKARALVASGGRLNSPSVVYALQHAGNGTASQVIQSLDKANLSPEERDYVISNLAAHENVQALRKSAGGTATDSSVAKLDALLPGGSTPDIDYLLNQTGQIRSTAQRLGKGVTTVKGGLKVDTAPAPKVKKFNPATGRLE